MPTFRTGAYGWVFATLRLPDGRTVEGSGISWRAAYLNALARTKETK